MHGQRGIGIGAVAGEGLGGLGLRSCAEPGAHPSRVCLAILGAWWRVHGLEGRCGSAVS
jgi:hypothetical protein